MKDQDKTKKQLISELEELRQRIAELQAAETGRKQVEEALRESRAELSAIIESAPFVMMIVDRERRVRKINHAGVESTGRPPEEVLGLRGGEALRCIHALDDPRGCGFGPACQNCAVRRTVLDTIETSASHHGVEAKLTFMREEGEERRTLLVYTTPLAVSGEPRVLVAFQDITERTRAEEALRESEERFRQIAENTRDIFWMRDLKSLELIYITPAYERLWGRLVEDTYPKPTSWMTDVHPEDQERVAATFAKQTQGEPTENEYRIVWPDGSIRWIRDRVSPIYDEAGEAYRMVGMIEDVTERKQAEEENRQHTAQLETLRQVGLELTSQLDLDALLRSIVSRATELLGAIEGGLYLYRPDRDVLEWAVAIGPHLAPLGSILHRGEGLCGKVWDTGEPLAVDDYQHWEGRAEIYEGYSFTATVGVPVYWGEEFLGALNVNADAPRTFSPDDVELLSHFATHAAIAIRNARLYEEARRRALEQETLRETALALTTTLDRDEVIDRILAQLQKVVPYDTASVQLLREGILEIVGGRGFSNPEEILGLVFDPRSSNNPNREVVRTGRPFIVDDAPAVYEEFRRDPHAPAGIRSWLGVPMLLGEQLIGMIVLDKSDPGFYTPEHARLAEAFAAQAAIAFENARLHQEVLDHAEQLEQRVEERTAELQAQYARLGAILRSTTDGIIVVDAEGSITQTNPVAHAWLTQHLSAEDAERLRDAVRKLARQAEELPETVLELTGLDLELKTGLVAEEGAEEPWAAVVNIHDVSHLRALDRMKTVFMTNVSHELRQPVSTIRSYAYLVQRTPATDEKWGEYLNSLVQETNRQTELVGDIMQISRIHAGRLKVERRPMPLNELSEAVVTSQHGLAQKRKLALEYRPLEPGPVAPVDPRQIAQVLNILMGNAIHYTPEGEQVVISTGTQEAQGRVWATVTVSDTGEAIPEEDLPHAFERFFREEEPRSVRVSETGLRLMIVKGIVELHGGHVTVESEAGVGSTFTIWLPLAINY